MPEEERAAVLDALAEAHVARAQRDAPALEVVIGATPWDDVVRAVRPPPHPAARPGQGSAAEGGDQHPAASCGRARHRCTAWESRQVCAGS